MERRIQKARKEFRKVFHTSTQRVQHPGGKNNNNQSEQKEGALRLIQGVSELSEIVSTPALYLSHFIYMLYQQRRLSEPCTLSVFL